MNRTIDFHGIQRRITGISFRFLVYILLFGLALVFIYPFLYMIVTSLKTYTDLNDIAVEWIPRTLNWQNYRFAFKSIKFPITFKNSVIVTAISTLGHLLACSLVAYGFARFKFPLKKVFFAIVLLSVIIPTQSIIVPQYLMYSKLHLVGSDFYLALLLPTFLGYGLKGGIFILVFHSFFQTLPKELEEAARIDGCSSFSTFFRIVVPSSSMAFLVCTVLSIVWHWNDYFEPLMYITSSDQFLLPQMLPSLYSMIEIAEQDLTIEALKLKNTYNQAVLMAATGISIAPVMVLYLFLQRKFMEGIARTGLTGE